MSARVQPAPSPPPSRLWKGAVIGLMVVGGLSMWILNPILWLWLTSHLQDSTQPSMGPYAVLLIGFILTCCAIGKGISNLNRLYARATGTTPTVHVIMPWRRSLRGGRSQKRETDGRLPVSVLDVIMVGSVVLAVVAFTAWYAVVQPAPPNIPTGPAKH